MAMSKWQTRRRRVYQILEQSPTGERIAQMVDASIIALVVANVAAYLLSTVPEIDARWGRAFEVFEVFSVAVFTIEYLLRLWSSVELPLWRDEAPWKTRLKFALRPLQLIDLLVILPFYLSFLFAIDLRVLRIFRLFRLLKLARYSPAMQAMVTVFKTESRALFGALLLMVCVLLIASTGMYFFEHRAQPDVFGSVPSAMWWAVATLTTVGYGDATPITTMGKIFGGIVMLFGLGMFALPIGILATGFSQEASRREFVVSMGLVAKVPIFSKLHATDIAKLLPLLHAVTYRPGELIAHAGDPATSMYFIASGKVEIDIDGEKLELSDGDYFGEMALLEKRPRGAMVRALTDCRLLVLDAPDFHRFMRGRPHLLKTIRKTAADRKLT